MKRLCTKCKMRISGYDSWCRKCHLIASAAWKSRNKDALLEYGVSYRQRNREKRKSDSLKWRQENREWFTNYKRINAAKVNADTAERRAALLNASPAWRNFIHEIYDLAIRRSKCTGFQWHVDHIVPLQSKTVCGLHVEDNLRVIPAIANYRKRNSLLEADK